MYIIINKFNSAWYGLKSNIDFRILREDLYPFFGGGNKARKLNNILNEIKSNAYNAVVTTGSIFSNHCRATALMCSNNGLALSLVLHGSKNHFKNSKGNSQIIRSIGSKIVFCEPDIISKTMNDEIKRYKAIGMKPYYLYGGGHNKKGVEAYIKLVPELKKYFIDIGWKPDYIFLPSGTGSTQAGLIIGSIKYEMDWRIIGISIARDKTKGIKSIIDTFNWFNINVDKHKHQIIFNDDYLAGGYALHNRNILDLSSRILKTDSLFFDPTYTAKAMWGTIQYILSYHIKGNILFMNTGGLFNYFNLECV